MTEDETVEQEAPAVENTVCLFHVKPATGGFIVEAQPGGKGDHQPLQAVVPGSLESSNSRKAVERNVRKMVKQWLTNYFQE